MDTLANIDRNKTICTGVGLDYGAPPDPEPRVDSEDQFITLVLAYSRLIRERIRDDIEFLLSVERSGIVIQFQSVLYKLRTAAAHDDNADAKDFYGEWTGRCADWQVAANDLVNLLVSALEHLDEISVRVRRDPKLSAAWKDRVSNATEAIFIAVCGDLDARFTQANTKRMVNNVSKLAERIPAEADRRVEIESLCAQQIASQRLKLPVPYQDVLDSLGLLGTRQARPALLVAYSVASSTQLSGEAFIARVEETWRLASS